MSKLYNLRGDKITGNSLEIGTTSVKSLVIGEDCYINNGMLYIKTHLYDSTVELYFDEFSGIVNENTTIATVKGDKVTVKNNNSTATVNAAYDDSVEGYIGVCVVILNEPYKFTQAVELQRENATIEYSPADGMSISTKQTSGIPFKLVSPELNDSEYLGLTVGKDDSNGVQIGVHANSHASLGYNNDRNIVRFNSNCFEVKPSNVSTSNSAPYKFLNTNQALSSKNGIKLGANDGDCCQLKYLNKSSNTSTDDALILDVGGSEKIVCRRDGVDINGGMMRLKQGTSNTIAMEGANENTIKMTGATNDHARIRMFSRDGSTNNGALEISTCDDSSEPIYFRQYQGNFNTVTRELALLDSTGNTYIPGTLFVKDQDILSDVNNLKALL